MSYLALYRKFRPETFDEVKGQDHIVTALRNQILADRVGHAYLFCGTRGTGKTSVAKILAKAVNCEHPVEGSPCGECETCRAIAAGNSLNVIEIDAASNNGVDNIRDIRDEVAYSPTKGRYKVYIIDEVHMLSNSAFNALLKTLEEPPSYVIFILATTEVQKIPATILSRCQRYDFRRISNETIADRLRDLLAQEGVEAEDKAIRYVAKAGDGSMRDALSLMDRCIAFFLGKKILYEDVLGVLGAVDNEVYHQMLSKVRAGDVAGCIHTLEDLLYAGRELGQFCSDFTWYLRNLLLVKTSKNAAEAVDASAEDLSRMEEEAKDLPIPTLMRYIRILSELSGQMRQTTQKRVITEVALIKMCQPQTETDLGSVLERLREVEKRIEEAPVVRSLPPTQGEGSSSPLPSPKEPERPLTAPAEAIQKAASAWPKIVGMIEQPLRACLAGAKVKYNGQSSGDGQLYVEVAGFGAGYAGNEEKQRQVEDAIREVTGLSVPVRLVGAKDGPRGLAAVDVSVEEMLSSSIDFEVDEVEEGEEEEW